MLNSSSSSARPSRSLIPPCSPSSHRELTAQTVDRTHIPGCSSSPAGGLCGGGRDPLVRDAGKSRFVRPGASSRATLEPEIALLTHWRAVLHLLDSPTEALAGHGVGNEPPHEHAVLPLDPVGASDDAGECGWDPCCFDWGTW